MEVILNQRVPNLGERGAIVRVADGYARNYLLPHGIAMLATKGARKQAEALQRAEQRRESERRTDAEATRAKFDGKAVTVRARANDQGKLYGSVSAKDVTEALRETHGLSWNPDQVRVPVPMNELGEFTVIFPVYQDIAAEIKVTVKPVEGETAAAVADVEPEPERRAPKPKPIIMGGAEQG